MFTSWVVIGVENRMEDELRARRIKNKDFK